MVTLREYMPEDVLRAAKLIRDTYSEYNLDFLPANAKAPFLGPFAFADDPSPSQLEDLSEVIWSDIVLVAEDQERMIGVLRGRPGRLGSLFVASAHQRMGVGKMLVEKFENRIRERGGEVIRVASSLYAVPFYLKLGYKRSTGIRQSWSFNGYGVPIQPMRKELIKA